MAFVYRGDLRDLIAVVDALAARGDLDRTRVGITGGSYGGYMTLRAITATPTAWAAAVESYGMPDLIADYRINSDRFGSWYETEMGTPKTHEVLFKDRSPIFNLEKVVAPLLVFQGANDSNVPKWESDLVVDALQKHGRVVDYVVYPNEGHGFTHRENRLDVAAHRGVLRPAPGGACQAGDGTLRTTCGAPRDSSGDPAR